MPGAGGGHVVDVTTAATTEASGRRLCLRQPADPRQLGRLRRRVDRWAAQNGVPADSVIDLQLALGEAVSNGVDHAYPDAERGTVEVELELRLDGPEPSVEVRVVDHGRWRPVPRQNGYRGRGLAMIAELTRGLRIATSERGTQLTFAVPVRR